MATWNTNSLLNKKFDLDLTPNIWMYGLYLRRMTSQSYIRIRGCKIYHTIHPDGQAKGSNAVIIKESTNHFKECYLKWVDI